MPLAHYLELLLPHLDAALANAAALGRIASLSRDLPGCAHGGFECRLEPGDDQVDLQINLQPGPSSFPDVWSNHPFWARFRKFCAGWSESGSPAQRAVADLWLEFDLDGNAGETPVPAVFLACRERVPESTSLSQAVRNLAGTATGADVERALARIAVALPASGRAGHVGLMLSRPGAPVRVNVAGLAAAAFSQFLTSLHWPGDIRAVMRLVEMAAPYCPSIAMALDVAPDGIESSIGLECRPGDNASSGIAMVSLFLDQLRARRLCDPAKARGVENWHGISWRARHRGAWPPELEWPDRLFSGEAESALVRHLNHIKLALRPDGQIQAKAYLAWQHQWLDRASLLAMLGAGAPLARGA